MKFKQHIPDFMEDFEKVKFEFNSLQELLNHEFIKERMNHKDFYRLSIGREGESEQLLMMELYEGKVWLVLGYITDGKIEGLPRWE